MVAKRRQGKSYLCKEILKILTERYDYYSVILFSETSKFEKNKTYGFVSEDNIFLSEEIDVIIPKILEF